MFRTAMLSLRAASPQTLDDYAQGIQTLASIHPSPEDWGLIYAADEVMRHEVWNKIRDEMVLENTWPQKCPWDLVIAKSTYGPGDTKRMHWWYLHVLAPALRGGKNLVRTVEGSSLIPSPDGLFGTTSSTPRLTESTSNAGATGKGGRTRPSRTERRARAAANWTASTASSSGYQGGLVYDNSKGKGNNKGHGKGENKNGKTKDQGKDAGGKGGKAVTK